MEVVDMEDKLIEGQEKQEGEGLFENYKEEKGRRKGRPRILKGEPKLDDNIDYENLIWEFPNTLELIRYGETSKYVVNLNLQLLGESYKNGLIYYRGDIQRGWKVVKDKEIPIHRPSKVKEIINAIQNDQWHGGSIILNAENKDEVEYDPDTKILKGHGRLYVIDGNHRLLACKKLAEMYNKGKIIQNPGDYEIVCIIDVTDSMGAAKIFSEHSLLPLRVQKSRSEYLQVTKLENIVARNIMKDSELQGRVETISGQPKGNNVISFNTLISGIEHIKPSTKEQAEVLSKNLIEYVNIIVNTFPEILGVVDKTTRDENRKLIFAGEPMFLEAFFAAFPVIVGKDDMIERFKSLRKTIKIGDWQGEVLSRDNQIWMDNITINGKIVNKRGTKKFVKDTIKEYLDTEKLPIEYEVVE
jgi:hypothetical protein